MAGIAAATMSGMMLSASVFALRMKREPGGAGVGAIIGAILSGAKGAPAGILIGGGGTIAATEGTDVELPAGTVLRVRMDAPLNLRR